MRPIVGHAEAKKLGFKCYFTGKPCRHGHIAERRTDNRGCVECIQLRRQMPVWQLYHREHHREWFRRWREANPELNRQQKRAWRLANREKTRAYYEANHKLKLEQSRQWSKANPLSKAATRQRRRARKVAAGGSLTRADLAKILQLQKHRCAYCRADLRKVKRHVDHIMPLILGGWNDKSNIQYLCEPCNRHKQGKDPLRHAREMGLLL